MIAALTNHLWQSTVFVLAAALVAAALRKNGAHIRHRIWVVASLKFLVPFSVLMSLGSALPIFRPSTAGAAPDTVTVIDAGINPPRVIGEIAVPNSVIGPPGNVAISPNGAIAIVASAAHPGEAARPPSKSGASAARRPMRPLDRFTAICPT